MRVKLAQYLANNPGRVNQKRQVPQQVTTRTVSQFPTANPGAKRAPGSIVLSGQWYEAPAGDGIGLPSLLLRPTGPIPLGNNLALFSTYFRRAPRPGDLISTNDFSRFLFADNNVDPDDLSRGYWYRTSRTQAGGASTIVVLSEFYDGKFHVLSLFDAPQ